MLRTSNEWIERYRKKGALWFHDGNSKRPHALFTSGVHSSGYANSELLMEDSLLLDEACRDLVELLVARGVDLENIDRVVGPAMGAITLAHDISRHIGRKRSRFCLRAYTEKEEVSGERIMVFKKTSIRPGERILIAEDVVTTGGSVDLTAKAVTKVDGTILPFTAVLVNQSGLKELSGMKIIALIDRMIPTWAQEDCPLCKEGSEAIRPKGVENWARLNADYK